MIIRKTFLEEQYIRQDRYVYTSNISDGAKVLYGYLSGLRNGANFSDEYIRKALGISKPVLANRKRELKAAGLILVERYGVNKYMLYLGSTKTPAAKVKHMWEKDTDGSGERYD